MATDDESAALLAALRSQRAHVLGTLDGLGDADLRRPVLPSGWSCLGLVNHLTLDVERFWFRAVVAGETVDLPSGDGGWQVGADTPARAVLDAYRDEAGARRRRDRRHTAGRGTPLVARGPVRRHPPKDLRQTVLHVLTETACHAGHLDAAAELIDGRTWLVLTD